MRSSARPSRCLAVLLVFAVAATSAWSQRPKIVPGKKRPAKKAPPVKRLAAISGFPDWVMSVAFSPDGKLLAAGSYQAVRLIDVATRRASGTISIKTGLARSLRFSPASGLLAVGSYQTVQLWDARKRRIVRDFEGHRADVTRLSFSADGRRLASCSEDESVRVWDVATGKEKLVIRKFRYPVQSVAFSPDGKWLATASGEPDRVNRTGHVRVWDAATGQERLWEFVDKDGNQQTSGLVVHLKAATDVVFSPDGKLLASTGFDEKVNVYDLETGKALGYFAGHARPTTSLVFAAGGKTVISGSGGRNKGKNEVKIWNRADGDELVGWEAHRRRITSIALSPDGKTLATASYDKTVAIWNVGPVLPQTGKRAVKLPIQAPRPRTATKPVSQTRPIVQTSGALQPRLPLTTTNFAAEDRAVDNQPRNGIKTLRAGIIGLDTSHVVAFTRVLNDPNAKPDVARCRVVAAYPRGSPDIASSVSRVPRYTQQMRKLGVEIVDSIPALLKLVDVVLLETNDGRPHLRQVLPVLKAGKPVFIDKPIAGTLADAVAIFEAARKYKTPVFSSSSLRYGTGSQAVRAGKIGTVLKAETYSPCSLEKTHPDLFWYGIHGVESLFTVMGAGCETVTRTVHTPERDVVVGRWKDGRTGTFSGYRKGGRRGYGGSATGTKGESTIGKSGGYRPLVAEIAKFFRTGKPPVSERETLEIYAFMEAADESKRRGLKPVALTDVLQKARKAAKRRLAALDR